MATFSLTIFGTFLTRSGVLDSVHSFTESPIGPWLLGGFAATVAVVLGLIAWRGDRLRSPGSIDSPLSREGAFLANNILFAAFAFVVLLGTVFPLLIEALKDERISVGTPYFDRMTAPIGLSLLFLMAVAPALPWRKASGELLRDRLQWPATGAVVTVVVVVALGARGLAPLLAFGLGAFAAGAAIRQIVLATRAHGWRGFIGRSNGGMVVHLGVVVVAVAFAASSSYSTGDEFRLAEGQSASIDGHEITFLGMTTEASAGKTVTKAQVRIDGGPVYEPALTLFPNATQAIATPSVKWGFDRDVFLVLRTAPAVEGGEAVIGVRLEPLVSWLWIGGGIMALGTVLAAAPGRRRRPTDPVSQAVPDDEPSLERREPVGVA
jgi:cytochrome c-type biogenesis protein CcmF